MEDIVDLVRKWFERAEGWQKDMFVNLWKGKEYNDTKNRITKLIYKQYKYKDCQYVSEENFPEDLNEIFKKGNPIYLKKIANVNGVGLLNSSYPLEFNDGLNVIYGLNGSGKSSYVKILKKAENPKNKTNIYSNVFLDKEINPTAELTFLNDGVEKVIKWNLQNTKNYPLRIYDTQIAHNFLEKSTEIIYEPKILNVFTKIVQMLEEIKQDIEREQEINNNQYIDVPLEFLNTEIYLEYKNMDSILNLGILKRKCELDDDQADKIKMLEKNISDRNPEKTKKTLENKLQYINEMNLSIMNLYKEFDISKVYNFEKMITKKRQIEHKIDEFINELKLLSDLDNFGKSKWRKMWQSAIDYYKELDLKKENICVLCQQELTKETKNKMKKFNEFYSSKIIDEKQKNDSNIANFIEHIDNLIKEKLNINEIVIKLNFFELDDEFIGFIKKLYEDFINRSNYLINHKENNDKIPTLIPIDEFNKYVKNYIKKIEKEINSIDDYIQNYQNDINKFYNLKCKKWFYDNMILFDIKKNEIILNKIKTKLKTNSITILKKRISDKLITDKYIKQFEDELFFLNPQKTIKVELIPDGKKGKISHKISIKGCKLDKKPSEILSEGEFRVVSLAAFLTDLNSINKMQTFIFDDPITSLDQNYENKVAQLLVKLSLERQVIVFTHRIAFVETLKDMIEQELKGNISNNMFNYIELLSDPKGEPRYYKYGKYKFIGNLNNMLNEDIPKVEKLRKKGEYDLAESKLNSILSTMRKTIESGIETELLHGVVIRYNKNISTLRLKELKNTNKNDIDLFDKMMTKYSFYEHSQPLEKTISLIELDELKKDIQLLIDWHKEFKNRNELDKK